MAVSEHMAIMEQLKGQKQTHNCPSCGGSAYCAMEAGKSASACWCMTVERDNKPETADMGNQCLCRYCLTQPRS